MGRRHAIAGIAHRFVPFVVSCGTGFCERVFYADGLYGVMLAEFPSQIVAIDEVAETRMERLDVVILQINFDEGFPVQVILFDFNLVENVVAEVDVLSEPQIRQIVRDVALAVEQHTAPVLQRGFR